eukprot:8928108-Pyramimonas_sp.AAC.1
MSAGPSRDCHAGSGGGGCRTAEPKGARWKPKGAPNLLFHGDSSAPLRCALWRRQNCGAAYAQHSAGKPVVIRGVLAPSWTMPFVRSATDSCFLLAGCV